MSSQSENVQINLKINGASAFTTLKDLNTHVTASKKALEKMNVTDSGYNEAATKLKGLVNAQKAWRSEINGTTEKQKDFNKELGKTTTTQGGFMNMVKSGAAGLAAYFSVGAVINFGKSVLDTTAKFQRMEAVLTTTLGSNSAAKLAMQQLQTFASETPFAVGELTDSFVKLANQGFKPSMEEMRKLGDLSASTGKSFDQLAEAILDAMSGENERLKEFGIKASKHGDQVTYTFKGVSTTIANTTDSIKEYLTSLGDAEGVSGSMAGISETLGGKISNLGDSWDTMLKTVGDETSGVFSGAIDIMGEAITTLNTYLADLNIASKYNAGGTGFMSRLSELSSLTGTTVNGAAIQRAAFANMSNALDEKIGGAKYFSDLIGIQKDLSDRMKGLDRTTVEGAAAWGLYIDKLKMVKDRYDGMKGDQVKERLKGEATAAALAAKEAEKLRKEREKAAKALEKQLEKEAENLKVLAAQMGTDFRIDGLEGLDKTLAEIDKKYNPLIEKAKKFNDQNSLEAFRYFKESAKTEAKNDDKYTDSTDAINNSFDARGGELSLAFNQRLAETPEELQYKLKQEYADKEYELELTRLTALKLLNESFGKDTADIDKKIADNKIAEGIRAAETRIAQDRRFAEVTREIEDAKLDAFGEGVNALKGFLNQRSVAFKAALIAEKAIAIANVVINLQREIAGVAAANAILGPLGIPITATQIGIAKVRAAFGIATIVGTGIKELSDSGKSESKSGGKYAGGGLLPNGPSHENGGIALIDPNGRKVGEIEGGEPILSRQTYANNRQLIDTLLYSSQRMNGARIGINTARAIEAERMFRNGGTSPVINNEVKASDVNIDLSVLVAEIKELRKDVQEEKTRPAKVVYHEWELADTRIKGIRNEANS